VIASKAFGATNPRLRTTIKGTIDRGLTTGQPIRRASIPEMRLRLPSIRTCEPSFHRKQPQVEALSTILAIKITENTSRPVEADRRRERPRFENLRPGAGGRSRRSTDEVRAVRRIRDATRGLPTEAEFLRRPDRDLGRRRIEETGQEVLRQLADLLDGRLKGLSLILRVGQMSRLSRLLEC